MPTASNLLGPDDAQPAGDRQTPGRPLPADPKLIFIALRCGRLGNRLLLFANFTALAEEQGHRLFNFTFHSYAHLFETTSQDIYCQYPTQKRRSLFEVIPGPAAAIRKTRIFYHAVRTASRLHERFPIFGSSVVTLRESPRPDLIAGLDGLEVQDQIREAKVVFVYGWRFQAPALVQRHGGKIRAYFRPIQEYENSSSQAVNRLRRQADVVVGVHLRLGDYYKWRGGKFFFPVSRYTGWMNELADQFPGRKVGFLVCSDEPRNPSEFPGLTVGLGPGSAMGDLYALAKCDYVLGPFSTFSQWASFYGEKPLFHLYSIHDCLELEEFRVSYLELPTGQALDGESPHRARPEAGKQILTRG